MDLLRSEQGVIQLHRREPVPDPDYQFLSSVFQSVEHHTQVMIFQPQGIDDGTFHYKFLETEYPDIVSDQIGGSLGLHDPMIQNSPGQYIHRHLFREVPERN